jgi:hypothetical protein
MANAIETAKSVETTSNVTKERKSLTAMVEIFGFSTGAKAQKTVKAAKQTAEQKKAGAPKQFYFTAAYTIKSVVDAAFSGNVGAEGISANIFGTQDEIKGIYDRIKAGDKATAYLYNDKQGKIILTARPMKLTAAAFAAMAGATDEQQKEISKRNIKYISIVDDADLDDEI